MLRDSVIAPLCVRLAFALVTTAPAAPDSSEPSVGEVAGPATPSEDPPEPSAQADPSPVDPSPVDPSPAGRLPARPLSLGLEGLVLQAPPLRSEVVRFDPRFVGRSISMGGLGVFARLRLHPRIAVETSVRSGSVRYAGRDLEDEDVVSHDQVMVDAGVLLFVAKGEKAQFAFDAGLGGIGARVKYELDREGSQTFGSGLVRVGASVEFVVKRIVFVISVRSYGVFTDRERVRNRGALLVGKTPRAPIPARMTLLVGSAGIAYRF